MYKTILSICILTLLTLTQLATADFTIFNDSNTTAWVVSSTINPAIDNYPAGWHTLGWYEVKSGASITLLVPGGNANVYLHVAHPHPSELKPTDHATRDSYYWLIHPFKTFRAVQSGDGSGKFLASNVPRGELIISPLYEYSDGGSIRVSANGRLLVGRDARASGDLTLQQMGDKLANATLISGLNIRKGDIKTVVSKNRTRRWKKNAFTYKPGTGKNRFVLLKQVKETCGTTSAEMVLRYYGQDVGQEEIWDSGGIHIIKLGSFPDELRQALGRLGVSAKWLNQYDGYSTIVDLKSWVRQGRPPIVLLRFGDFLHYLVVVGYDNQGDFLLADPNGHFRWMSSDDLVVGWSITPPGLPNADYEVENGFMAAALETVTTAARIWTQGMNVIVPINPPGTHLPENYSVLFKPTGSSIAAGVVVRGGNRFNPAWTTDRWEETFTFRRDIADYRVAGVVPRGWKNLGGLEPAYIQGHKKVNNRTVKVWGRVTPGRVTKGEIYVFVRGFGEPVHGSNTVSSTQSKRYSSKWGFGSDKSWHTFTFPGDVSSYTISSGISFADRWGAELLEHRKTGNQVKFKIKLGRHKLEENEITINVTAHHEPVVAGRFTLSYPGSLSNIPSGESKKLTVKVYSTKGHLMKGVKVQFTDIDDSEIAFSPTSATTNSSGVATSTMRTGSHGSADFVIAVAGGPSKKYNVSVARTLKEHTVKKWFSSRHSGQKCWNVFLVGRRCVFKARDWYTASKYIDVPSWVSIHSYRISTHVPFEDLATKPYVKSKSRSGNRVFLKIRFKEHWTDTNNILVRVHAKYWGTNPSPGAPLNPEVRPDPEMVTAAWQDLSYIPSQMALLPNYPNPFNPETWIPYHLSEAADVTLTIYSADGRLVRTLALGHQPAGIYENKSRAAYWDGRNAVGERVASGIYFYRLSTGNFAATGKMLIMK